MNTASRIRMIRLTAQRCNEAAAAGDLDKVCKLTAIMNALANPTEEEVTMAQTYSYDVDVVAGDGYSSHQVDDVVQFETGDQWVTFYAAAGEILAVFAASSVVSIVKDADSGKDTDAA